MKVDTEKYVKFDGSDFDSDNCFSLKKTIVDDGFLTKPLICGTLVYVKPMKKRKYICETPYRELQTGGIAAGSDRWNGLLRATRTGSGREDGEETSLANQIYAGIS